MKKTLVHFTYNFTRLNKLQEKFDYKKTAVFVVVVVFYCIAAVLEIPPYQIYFSTNGK